MLGFAFGWALLALQSARLTDRPQRWAAIPAAATAVTGGALIVLAPDAAALDSLGWVRPPPLLALVVWTGVHARRPPVSRVPPWLLHPVFAFWRSPPWAAATPPCTARPQAPPQRSRASGFSTSAGTA
jgi:hypothetical protein